MASETTIANMSMRILKAQRITSLDQDKKNAHVANDVFVEVRDELLRSHPWNFATKRVKLAQASNEPAFEFDHAYPLPSDWMRTVQISQNDAGTGTVFYREEEQDGVGVILSSADELWMRYVYRVTDPNRMTPGFRATFALFLAVAMPGISNLSAAREDALEKRAKAKLRTEKHADAMGSTPERRPPGSWVTAHAGRGSSRAWPG